MTADFDRALWCACHTVVMENDHDTVTRDGLTHTAGLCLVSRAPDAVQYGIKWAGGENVEGPCSRKHAERTIALHPSWGGALVSRTLSEWREDES